MWYILYMNKDVIYIEPDDDITDIITKIEGSKEKIVALVPPKKAGVFRSVVNIKLIAKSGKTAEKTIVLVTTDPSIVKLAAATRLPVTKNLQTPPVIPEVDTEIAAVAEEEIVNGPDELIEEEIDKVEGAKKKAEAEETGDEKEDEDSNGENEDTEDTVDSKPKKKEKKAKKTTGESGNPIINWIKNHKKTTVFGAIAAVALIVFLVWAFAIAPAVNITVGISTETSNFSEMVTFTTNVAEENAAEGKFYLQEKVLENVAEVKFDATGKKNNGEKAKGDVVIYTYFKNKGTKAINAGATFSINGLNYTADQGATLSWDGETMKDCENNGKPSLISSGCQVSARVAVTAAAAGANYNIAASNSGWNTTADVGVYSDKAMGGGTDDIVTVVEQSDIEKAKDELKASNEEENKAKLMSTIDGNVIVIDSSFEQETSAATATPAAGEEVKDDQQPVLKATTTAKVFVVDKTKVEEFITGKAKIGDDQKVYEIKDPYIENFVKGDSGYAGKLKTSYAVGPKVTENDILEMVKGKGIGDAIHDLKSINGITTVDITPSYPWVFSVPGDTNKIFINTEVKNNGNSENKEN